MARLATTTDIFNAIAEPKRREILAFLRPGERSVNDVAKHLHLTQPQASKHLKVLKEVGAVKVREAGQQRLYVLDGGALEPVNAWIKQFAAFWEESFERMDELLAELQAERRRKEAENDHHE
jgi:DNA-binding transcriptional ArsR family regulator